jgi:hypothetical protein
MDFTQDIGGKTLEFFENEHMYLVDGVEVPSITQLLQRRFGGKYRYVDKAVLKRAADAGTAVHEAVERWCRFGEESDLPEVRNFKFLQRQYGFEVLENETPVILSLVDEPVAAGRLDLVLSMDGRTGGADIKRTSQLDREYIAAQLNLYRIAYRQCYGVEWEFLRGVHLRMDVRRFVEIPINEDLAWGLVNDYLKECR